MLLTPFGEIEVLIDGVIYDYIAEELPIDSVFYADLDGRYLITINYVPDGERHVIECKIKNCDKDVYRESQNGEMLESLYFSKGKINLSIGTEGETLCDDPEYNLNDYDIEYLEYGMSYIIEKSTKTSCFRFGIAWLLNAKDEYDCQTWYGSDPSYR